MSSKVRHAVLGQGREELPPEQIAARGNGFPHGGVKPRGITFQKGQGTEDADRRDKRGEYTGLHLVCAG